MGNEQKPPSSAPAPPPPPLAPSPRSGLVSPFPQQESWKEYPVPAPFLVKMTPLGEGPCVYFPGDSAARCSTGIVLSCWWGGRQGQGQPPLLHSQFRPRGVYEPRAGGGGDAGLW